MNSESDIWKLVELARADALHYAEHLSVQYQTHLCAASGGLTPIYLPLYMQAEEQRLKQLLEFDDDEDGDQSKDCISHPTTSPSVQTIHIAL